VELAVQKSIAVVLVEALLVASLAAASLFPRVSWAALQDEVGPERAGDDGAPAGRARRERTGGSRGPMLVVLRIAEALQLNDAQTVKLAGEFRRVAEQRRGLLAQKATLATKLEAQLARKPADDGVLTTLTDQIVALEREILLLPEGLWQSIQPVLTPEQRARLILLRGKMKQEIDGERKRRRAQGRTGTRAPQD
jgi:hypothetical protein